MGLRGFGAHGPLSAMEPHPIRRPERYYLDTSVFGGCCDPEFRTDSLRFFEQVRSESAIIVVSPVVIVELAAAPEAVLAVFRGIDRGAIERLDGGDEAEALSQVYLAERVVPPRYADDALHVATATVLNVGLIVSWNFKHIVNVSRVRGFNSINVRLGYPLIDIRSPKELLHDDS